MCRIKVCSPRAAHRGSAVSCGNSAAHRGACRRYSFDRARDSGTRLVASGHSNKITAARLSVSEDPVKNHMSSILMKLSANDRNHAVTIAMRRGFLDG
ncbi:response regulator transcription factor [Acidisarcina polymorpha]|uniref:response regulator transcription factor n=1 Tax=Acidisarcina polymorpha TaxID=2211140 RepID=UPI001F006A8A|nr:LuxR C-terminal-related transcriptional regulator [Acidisarcina polymorpha]